MWPRKQASGQQDLFKARLDEINNMEHELTRRERRSSPSSDT